MTVKLIAIVLGALAIVFSAAFVWALYMAAYLLLDL